jgi:hypothetical protein
MVFQKVHREPNRLTDDQSCFHYVQLVLMVNRNNLCNIDLGFDKLNPSVSILGKTANTIYDYNE